MGVGENIRKLRRDAGLSQAELARRIGFSRASVNQWEHGVSQPRMGTVRKLAEVFGVPISTIVADETPSSIQIDARGEYILFLFYKLNDEGKMEAAARLREMTELPRWSR